MLNEMNPKLKALLAAGLIGTAGLGMQSCSNPSDSVYYPYTVETTTTRTETTNPGGSGTENPGDGGDTETPNPSNPDNSNPNDDNDDNGEKGETMEGVTFDTLRVKPDDANRLKNVRRMTGTNWTPIENMINLVYMGKDAGGFIEMSKLSAIPDSYANIVDLCYLSNDGYVYHIPANMRDYFIAAGASL